MAVAAALVSGACGGLRVLDLDDNYIGPDAQQARRGKESVSRMTVLASGEQAFQYGRRDSVSCMTISSVGRSLSLCCTPLCL